MAASGPDSGRQLIACLVDDLDAESRELRAVLEPLPAADWARPTPADGWTITDQVTHLAYFDDVTCLSITDLEQFQAEADRLMSGGMDFPDRIAAQFHQTPPDELLAWFDRSRAQLIQAFREVDPAIRLPWLGPAMKPASSATARLMETWAHGQDILDTLGIARRPTARLRHVADIGIRALRYSYTVRHLPVPADPIRVELAAPDGQLWAWGPSAAANQVTGDALDFCLVVTQRRHRDDTGLEVRGPGRRPSGSASRRPSPARPARPEARTRPDRGPSRRVTGRTLTCRTRPAAPAPARRPIRIGNSSGFFGDRMEAAREMVEGGPIDVLSGDYLAELTMLILWKARQKDPDAGYARTVLAQLEHVLGSCLDRGIKIVNNAGGLNPAGLAGQFAALAERLGLHPKIAYVTGDDLLPRLDELVAAGHGLRNLDTGQSLADAGDKPVTANAYLGGWGITAALDAGADIVICPRVTDASLVTGPAAWWHGWGRDGLRPARRGGRRRAHHRVRPAGHRRQLLLPARDHRPPLPRLPHRRGRRATAAA